MYYFAAEQRNSTAKLPEFFQNIYKTVRALRINKTKVFWRKAFIVNLFALENEKKPKK